MIKTVPQNVVRDISRKREQIATLREELEDLNDYLDLTEARVRDEGKPRLTHAEVKKRYGLK
jgi:LytS/YehU family sensor histidine kinase